MTLGHYAVAVVVSAVICVFTDWFFMGFLFHEKYKQYPEVWRNSGATGNESKAIAWSMLMTLVTCIAFVYVEGMVVASSGYSGALALTVGIWLAIPVPLLITNSIFIKLHPLVVVSHSLGWLAKMLACYLSVRYLS
jgi:uncharacterized membrane protein YbaN (DUF454 family)